MKNGDFPWQNVGSPEGNNDNSGLSYGVYGYNMVF